MRKPLTLFCALFWLLHACSAASIVNLVEIACRRNATLKICPKQEAVATATTTTDNVPRLPPLLPGTRSVSPLSRTQALVLRQLAYQTRQVRNPFNDDENVLLDEDLIDFDEEDDKVSSKDSRFSSVGRPAKAPTGVGPRVDEYCRKFQDNYAYYCGDSIDKTPSLKTQLTQFCPSYETNCPDKVTERASTPLIINPKVAQAATDFPDTSGQSHPDAALIATEKKLAALIKAHPCKPNCDVRVFKHCTAECKCDYLYPYVQRFCNPPPMPIFLNTCRLWYHGCPKYAAYHYASQYIYSKAGKGKTLAGLAVPKQELAYTPPVILPGAAAQGELTRAVRPEKVKELANRPENPRDPFESVREDFFKEHNIRPKARQAPSATADTTLESSVHQFDSYTDSKGVAYRARSRSPFSKPGLWEANPDDPHNRDHANKFWYRPESVGVDWLSGQIAYGAHWAVPAAGVGGTDGFSAIHFPTIGNFLNIADDYD